MTASDRAARVVKEAIGPFGARFLHRSSKVICFLVIYSRIEPDLPTPLKLVFAPGNGNRDGLPVWRFARSRSRSTSIQFRADYRFARRPSSCVSQSPFFVPSAMPTT
jgi:hypothetical protein